MYVFIYCFFLLLILVVVERTMSWLVEQDGARIFLPLSNVCQRQNEKQSAKLTRTIALLCFSFVFLFFCVAISNISQRLNEKQNSQKLSPCLALNVFPPKSLQLNYLDNSYHGYSTTWQGQIKTSMPSSSQPLAKRRN